MVKLIEDMSTTNSWNDTGVLAAAAASSARSLEDTSDPCARAEISSYDQSLQVASIFILFAASAIGVALPLLPKYSRRLSLHPFLLVLGKCAGAGVMLSCALVHMVLPSTEALTSECVPTFFNTTYPAFSFFFAMLAALSSHLIEFVVESSLSGSIEPKLQSDDAACDGPQPNKTTGASSLNNPTEVSLGEGSRLRVGDAELAKVRNYYENSRLVEAKQLSETLLVEFSLSVHSVIVGLALGVSDGSTLRALLIALVFHQLLEGVALGCRLADSSLSARNVFLFAILFSISSSIGVAIGIGVYNSINPSGEAFLLVTGILDGICGGLLLYNGFVLLLVDFPLDLKAHCVGEHRRSMIAGMFSALWIAALGMSIIGAWA